MGILDIVPFRQRRANVPAPADRDRDPILALQAEIDRAFGNFWNIVPFPNPQAMLSAFADVDEPDFKVDVRDTGKEVEVVAELPGFSEDDIEVTAGPDSITIRAERQEERQGGDEEGLSPVAPSAATQPDAAAQAYRDAASVVARSARTGADIVFSTQA